MSSFPKAMDFVLSQEGGLVNDPVDPGGITNHGISLRFAQQVHFDPNRDGRVDALDIKGLSAADAIALYRQHFWIPIRGDELPSLLAISLFDMAVNQGVKTSIQTLQRVLRIPADGVIGPKTMQAIERSDFSDLIADFLVERLLRYAGTRNFDRFGRGWFRRVLKLHTLLLTSTKGKS